MSQIQRQKTSVLAVSLPKKFQEEVVNFAAKRDLTTSQVVKQALKSYLIKQEIDEIQDFLQPAFLKLGILTDEDVEKYFG